MNRRNFLGGLIAAICGLLPFGKKVVAQPISDERKKRHLWRRVFWGEDKIIWEPCAIRELQVGDVFVDDMDTPKHIPPHWRWCFYEKERIPLWSNGPLWHVRGNPFKRDDGEWAVPVHPSYDFV